MQIDRPYALSIAGFDPSAGAGVLADVKTFEGLRVYGLAISTAVAIQTDEEFVECRWENIEEVKKQIELLLKRYSPQYIKIGIVPSLFFLNQILDDVLKNNSNAKIIWDPVYTSSTGFQFMDKNWKNEDLFKVLKRIYLLTPNRDEAIILSREKDALKGAKKLSEYCSVLLKGGHNNELSSTDILFSKGGEKYFEQQRLQNVSKHGSGCVLSSAITACLAKGESLENACARGKEYIYSFLKSSNSLLGYHVS